MVEGDELPYAERTFAYELSNPERIDPPLRFRRTPHTVIWDKVPWPPVRH